MKFTNEEELQSYAALLAKDNPKILLWGELGAGKTTFAKWFASAIGIDPMKVTSPTYTYQNVYDDKLLHVDMYRIAEQPHLHETGLLEQINNHDYILIERPKWEDKYADPSRMKIEILKEADGSRTLNII